MAIHTSQKIEFINISEVVREIERKFSIDPHYRDWKNKKEINIRCPECSVKKFHAHYHLGLNFAKNAYNCYRCPFHGRLSDFLRANSIRYETKTQIYRPEVLSISAPKIKMPIDFGRNEAIANKAKAYMFSRGFDLVFLKKNFKIWPITNIQHYYFGYIITEINGYAFYARKFLDLKNDRQKHIIRKSDPQMKLFYSYEKNNSQTTLVVESMFNLMKAAQFGYDAVCIFGKVHWSGFIEYLKTIREDNQKNLCLCFDKDVIIKDIDKFVTKTRKAGINRPLFYIDPEDMPCNDIADMQNRETLVGVINKQKSVDDLYMNMMSIGE